MLKDHTTKILEAVLRGETIQVLRLDPYSETLDEKWVDYDFNFICENCRVARPNKEVVQAWLDGKDIQYRRNPEGGWINFTPERTDENPMIENETQWRVKPEQ